MVAPNPNGNGKHGKRKKSPPAGKALARRQSVFDFDEDDEVGQAVKGKIDEGEQVTTIGDAIYGERGNETWRTLGRAGRPPLDVDLTQIAELAFMGLSAAAIAGILDVPVKNFFSHGKYDRAYHAGKGRRELALRSTQTQIALSGNPQMLVWLGKQELGQTDKSTVTHDGMIGVEHRRAIEDMLTNPDSNLAAQRYARKMIVDAQAAVDVVEGEVVEREKGKRK